MLEKLKKIYLQFIVGYRNPKKYWNERWRIGLNQEKWKPEDIEKVEIELTGVMKRFRCGNILEIGCGKAILKNLNGYTGLDFSLNVLESLKEFIFADVGEHIPLPDKSFDATLCMKVLLHVKPDKIENAVKEICRVTKNVIILDEPPYKRNAECCKHNFNHDLTSLFERNISVGCRFVFLGEHVV